MSTSNSISALMEQFLELNTNSLETFERINEAITTDKETVTINMYDGDSDKLKTIQLPSFGYLKRELDRLDANVSGITLRTLFAKKWPSGFPYKALLTETPAFLGT